MKNQIVFHFFLFFVNKNFNFAGDLSAFRRTSL